MIYFRNFKYIYVYFELIYHSNYSVEKVTQMLSNPVKKFFFTIPGISIDWWKAITDWPQKKFQSLRSSPRSGSTQIWNCNHGIIIPFMHTYIISATKILSNCKRLSNHRLVLWTRFNFYQLWSFKTLGTWWQMLYSFFL